MKRKRSLLVVACVAFLSGYGSVSLALDTDIYLDPVNVSRDDAPNVLVIFDNSSSMAGNYVTTSAPYITSKVYVYAGASPGVPFETDKIYWKTNTQAEPTSADTYPDQWFLATNNRCKRSGLPWHLAPTTDAAGKVSVTPVMRPNNGLDNWTTISTDTTGVVDCREDHNAGAANTESGESGGQWIRKNSNGYTDNWNQRLTNWGPGITLYSGNYLNYRSQPTSVVETRLEVAKRVVKQIVDSNPGVNFGLMLFNRNMSTPHGGYVAMSIGKQDDDFTYGTASNRKDALKAILDDINPPAYGDACDGSPSAPASCGAPMSELIGTPLAETMYEAKLYLSGETPKYGYPAATPTPPPDTTAVKDGKYVSPFKYNCQHVYIIYMTDGNPWLTDDNNANSDIDQLPNIGSFNSAYPNGNSSKLDELAGWLYENDLVSDSLRTDVQRAVTFTIGFDLKPDSDPLDADGVALLDDTARRGKGGRVLSANNADQLNEALQTVLIDIQTSNSSFAAPALSVNAFNKLFNRDEVYFALFKPSATKYWDGNVKKYKLCNDTTNGSCAFGEIIDKDGNSAIDPVTKRIVDEATSYWTPSADGGDVTKGGAGGQLPAPGSRDLYTYRGSYTSGSLPATPFLIRAASGNALYDAAINDPTILGLPDTSGSPTDTNAADTAEVEKLINWMLGQDSYDRDADTSTTDARWAHSDPLHSRPVAITYGGSSATPIIKLFYASNDGIIRMINDGDGQEEWAFVPQELLGQQAELAADSAGTHVYGVDGTPSFWVQDIDGNGIIEAEDGDHVYMYVGMRRGGRNIYAFDVTPADGNPTSVTPKLMWVIKGGEGDYVKLAQTWSKPTVARIRYGCSASCTTADDSSVKTVLIFGGGYDWSEDVTMPVQAHGTPVNKIGNAIYIADPSTGARLWWASDGQDSVGNSPTLTLARMNFSIASDLALMDSNHDGEIDRIYVGDTGGQLWRIDLAVNLRNNNNGNTKGFVFADVACTSGSRPNCSGTENYDRRKFFYPPDVAQVNDSQYEDPAEAKYDLIAIATGDREDPLDKLTTGSSPVHNRIYAFRDHHIDTYATASATVPTSALTHGQLYNATDDNLSTATGAALTAEINSLKASKGWYIDLREFGASAPAYAPATWPWVGEKGLAKAVIFDGSLSVTTFVPPSDLTATQTCYPGEGAGKLFTLNYLNATAAIDFDKSGETTTADRSVVLGGGIPSEIVIVIREGGVTSLVGTSGGAARPDINSKLPRFKTFWYEE